MHDRGSLTLPRIGAQRVRASWHDRFAETPDVLKSPRRQQTIVPVLDLEIGGGEFITMAGPCSVETEFQLMATAHHVRRGGARILRGGAFKPRSSPYSFQGHGLEGLKMLARAREESGLAIVTEVMCECDVPMVAEYADILQIGTRNMENYSLLEAAARSGRPILLKRGMVATIDDFLRSAQFILDNGNPNVILCERGIRTFETATRNTFDVGAIALLKHISHLPVIADPSHAAGHRELVPALARVAVAAEADGLAGRGASQSRQGVERWGAVAGLRRVRRHDGCRSSHTSRCAALLPPSTCRRAARWRPWDEGPRSVSFSSSVFRFAAFVCGFASNPSHKIDTARSIVTAAPVYEPLAALRGEERFPHGRAVAAGAGGKRGAAGAGLRSERRRECLVRWQARAVCGQEGGRRSVADLGAHASGSLGAQGDRDCIRMPNGHSICRVAAWSGPSEPPKVFNCSRLKTATN